MGQRSEMFKRRQGQKEGDETKKKAMEAEGEDRDRKGMGIKRMAEKGKMQQ